MCLPFKHKTFQDSSGYKSIIPSEKNSVSYSTIIPHLIITQDKWNSYLGALKSYTGQFYMDSRSPKKKRALERPLV